MDIDVIVFMANPGYEGCGADNEHAPLPLLHLTAWLKSVHVDMSNKSWILGAVH